jgi:hypothetical protein
MTASNLHRLVLLVLVFSLCLHLANLARGQALPAATISAPTTTGTADDFPALRIAVAAVSESRNSQGRGILTVTLSIMGEGLPPGVVVKQITVTKAVDNLGNLLGSSIAGPSAAMIEHRRMLTWKMVIGPAGRGSLNGQIFLDTSLRKAESLQYVEGSIELFVPVETTRSIIHISNVLSNAGRIEDPALAGQGIEFHFLPGQASSDEAKTKVAGAQTSAQPPDFPNAVGSFLRDSSGRLATHQLQEANGIAVRPNGTLWNGWNGSQTGSVGRLVPLPADPQPAVFLAMPEAATKTVPFRVENILLP